MTATRPKTITIIAALLVGLAILSIISALTTQSGFPGARPQGAVPGNAPSGSNFQGNNGNPQGQNNGGNFQPRNSSGGFSLFSITRSLGLGGQFMGYLNTGIAVGGVVLALVSAYGVWKQKRWALNLAIVLAILFLLGALPGLFFGAGRAINWLRMSLNALSAMASLAILGMGILPSVRDFVS